MCALNVVSRVRDRMTYTSKHDALAAPMLKTRCPICPCTSASTGLAAEVQLVKGWSPGVCTGENSDVMDEKQGVALPEEQVYEVPHEIPQ